MATANAAATLERANDFKTDYDGQTVEIRAGANVLATHTLGTFTTANAGSAATATLGGVPNTATITGTGTQTADGVFLLGAGGKEYNVTADSVLATTTYVNGETSSITSLVVTFPVS